MDKKARQFRMEQLKNKSKKENQFTALFEECIDVLGDEVRIYSLDESVRIVAHMVIAFPFTEWGRVDWKLVKSKTLIKKLDELSDVMQLDLNKGYYVVWDELNLPVIETKLARLIERQDDVTAVGFNVWFINFEIKTIIEVHHEGEINVGKLK
ncbi:CDI toxin immunity protein [Paenibacillus glycinis]|uniref:Uncharacterized protein n=1 Tax=Paenibacillus glycinis TaxID=2697035 RepID=A0ABW9XRX5_9BACL|nr:hypothetical protein [Paenibacillus glycinis]NBD25408.1 hypothetical protein [Paenibacillus glycinis]